MRPKWAKFISLDGQTRKATVTCGHKDYKLASDLEGTIFWPVKDEDALFETREDALTYAIEQGLYSFDHNRTLL